MAYLDTDEYVERFGSVETIRVTDEAKAGVIDTNKLQDAIDDASAFADSYLAVKYVIPITGTPPVMLKRIIGDIARYYLHKTKPTPAVEEGYTMAVSQLKDLAAGRATIPIADDGTVTPETASGTAVRSGDGKPRIFTSGRLRAYTCLDDTATRYGYGGPVFSTGDSW